MNTRILIVADQSLIRHLVGLLGVNNFDPVGVSSREEALDQLRTNPGRFDVVITDTQVPRLDDGIQLVREIKADDTLKHIPVMVMAKLFGHDEIWEAERAGAFVCIERPFSINELAAYIDGELARLAVQN